MIIQLTQEELPHYYKAMKEIYQAAFDYTEEQADFLQMRIEQSKDLNPIVLVALEGEEVVGFLFGFDFVASNWWAQQLARSISQEQLAPYYNQAYELNEIAVLPTHQAKGYGQALMDTVINKCAHRDILLGTKLEDNEYVIRFYRKLNFQDVANPFYYENNVYGASLILCRHAERKMNEFSI